MPFRCPSGTTTVWHALYSDWGNFENWLRYYGWVFWALISLLTLSILINLWFYWERWAHLHLLKERDRERYGLRSDVGRVLAVLGGVIALIAQILPWVGFRPTSACPGCGGGGPPRFVFLGGGGDIPLFALLLCAFFAVLR